MLEPPIADESAGLRDAMPPEVDPIVPPPIANRSDLSKEAFVSPRAIIAMAAQASAPTSTSILDLPDEALLCLFESLSPARGKRVLIGQRDGKFREESPGPRPLSQAHPRLRKLYMETYLRAVTIVGPHLPPNTFFDELFADKSPHLFDPKRIAKLHLKRVFCSETALTMGRTPSVASLPVLPRVNSLRVSRPLALSEYFLDALPVTFPNVAKFFFSHARYGVLRFDEFLAEIVGQWKTSLSVLNLSGVHGVCSNLETCFAKVAECRHLEDLDLSRWKADHFASSSLRQSDITPLRVLTGLKRLSLRHCVLSERSFKAVMQSLSELSELDVMESSLGPNVATLVPSSVTILRAGGQYLEGDYFSAESDGPSFFVASKLPNLRTLEWGYWPEQDQGWGALRPLAPQLLDLRVHGPGYQASGAHVLAEMKKLKVLCLRSCLPSHAAQYTDVVKSLKSIEVDCFFDNESVPGLLEFRQRRALKRGSVSTVVFRVAADRHAFIDEIVSGLRNEYPRVSLIVDEESDDYVPYLNDDSDDDLLRHRPDSPLLSSGVKVEVDDMADEYAYYF